MDELDSDTNAIVALCAAGMEAEGRGATDEAAALFRQAWDESTDDYQRCIAAHYVARSYSDPTAALEWNERALALAHAVGEERTAGFQPSLHLNIGRCHEDLGDLGAARAAYLAAAAAQHRLGDDGYGAMLRRGIAAALDRTDIATGTSA